MLMAGLDGIRNKIDPGPPLDKDIYELSKEEIKHVPSLPGSLEESLKALAHDHKFLFEGGVFTEEFVHLWINYKMEKEVNPMRMRPHPYEFHLYYDI
jgi:glutamine synthetase